MSENLKKISDLCFSEQVSFHFQNHDLSTFIRNKKFLNKIILNEKFFSYFYIFPEVSEFIDACLWAMKSEFLPEIEK